jgi:hypothetical protein
MSRPFTNGDTELRVIPEDVLVLLVGPGLTFRSNLSQADFQGVPAPNLGVTRFETKYLETGVSRLRFWANAHAGAQYELRDDWRQTNPARRARISSYLGR